MTSMSPEVLKAMVKQAFPDAELELKDLTGTQDHYELHIASSVFEGLTPIKQHRLVYAALEGRVGQEIHALALKTYTPAAWRRRTSA